MIRYESVYVYFIATKNVGDYSYMSSPNIYYRAFFCISLYGDESINVVEILRLYNSISAAKKKKYHVHLIDAHGIR